MKKLLLLATALAGIASAQAADIPPARAQRVIVPQVTVWDWSGFYVGGNVGYANAYRDESLSGGNAVSSTVIATGIVPSSMATRGSGWLGGIQAGYNFQFGSIIAGVEADIDWSGVKASASQNLTAAPIGFPVSLTTTADRGSHWFGTVRGRLGTTMFNPQTLVYATGGLAFANVYGDTMSTLVFGKTSISAADSYSTTRLGWTAGAGIESVLSGHWTWKAEYLYLGLGGRDGSMSATVGGTPVIFNTRQDLSEHIVRLGVNYKF